MLVENYGAVGDGSTDDSAAIQAAIDSNNIVEFTPGKNYLCGGMLVPSGRRINWQGARLTKTLSSDFVFRTFFNSSWPGNQYFTGSIINMQNSPGVGIWLEGTWYGLVENLDIRNVSPLNFTYNDASPSYGSQSYRSCGVLVKGVAGVSGAYYNTIRKVFVRGVDSENYANNGITLTSTTEDSSQKANATVIDQCRTLFCNRGIEVENGNDAYITMPEVSWCREGIKTNSKRTHIIKPYAEHCNHGIRVTPNGEDCIIDGRGAQTGTDSDLTDGGENTRWINV